MEWYLILSIAQFVFTLIIALYFFILLKGQRSQKQVLRHGGKEEWEALKKMRAVRLTEPLTEQARPQKFEDIIGQADGIRALKAAICGPNPQHVIIYGPPGVGKTAASRLVLEYAKQQRASPFSKEGRFVEIDATTARFDERGIADPLIGSVHDPIYQGAGSYGQAGIPQPKKGAVTDANGGILFIDEIGELHKIQMNKLLKILEDRKVLFDSVYYSKALTTIPPYIHDIFQNGMPADFRLIGATTRQPHEISPALRSRCVEIYFRGLEREELEQLALHAVQKIGFLIEKDVCKEIATYVSNGREAVNLVQLAAGIAEEDGRRKISHADVQWIVYNGQLEKSPQREVDAQKKTGVVNGLGVSLTGQGAVLEIEILAQKSVGDSKLTVTGIIEEEVFQQSQKELKRTGLAYASIQNVLTYLKSSRHIPAAYDYHINFPGGAPIDGPSAGLAIAVGVYDAVHKKGVAGNLAFTGEMGIHGHIKPVGGVYAKAKAAKRAGVQEIWIPKENLTSILEGLADAHFKIHAISHFSELVSQVFMGRDLQKQAEQREERIQQLLHSDESSAG